jgi:uncharacterized protein (DUF2147 family)
MKRWIVAAALASAFCGTASADVFDVFGTFRTQAGTSHIEIADCGNGSPCGKVVWLDAKALPKGETPETITDAKGAKLMGMKLLAGFQRKKADWRGGTIYDPEAGKLYDSRLKRRTDGKLEVKGCIGPICQTQVWTPVKP